MSLIIGAEKYRQVPVNKPRPGKFQEVQEELIKIGGRVPSGNGSYSNSPIFQIVWGMTAQCWSAGRKRIRFFNQDIDPIFTRRAFAVRPELLDQIRIWENYRRMKMRRAFEIKDWKVYHAIMFAPMEWFLLREASSFDWYKLDRKILNRGAVETSLAIPDGWLFYEDIPEVEEIGNENFYVLRWTPAHHIDDKETWDENRFGYSPIIEFYGKEFFVDQIGPYPVNGGYATVMLKIEKEDGSFAEPGRANCIEPIREMLHRQEHNKAKRRHSIKWRVENRLQEAIRQEGIAAKQHNADLEELFHEKGRVIIRGSKAHVYEQDKPTMIRKPDEVINARDLIKGS